MQDSQSGRPDRTPTVVPTQATDGGESSRKPGSTRWATRKPTLQIGTLLVVTLVLGLLVWLANEKALGVLLAALVVAIPVIAAAAFVLYREKRSQQAMQRALESIEARARGFFESAMDPIITIDESQRIVLFNARGRGGVRLAARRGHRAAGRHADPRALPRRAPRPRRPIRHDRRDVAADGRTDRARRPAR